MGKHRAGAQKRQQRAQERRKRRVRDRARPSASSRSEPIIETLTNPGTRWFAALVANEQGNTHGCEILVEALAGHSPDSVDAVIWDDFHQLLPVFWEGGWQPRELAHVVRRNLKRPHEDLVALLMLEQSHDYRDQFEDAEWSSQLDALPQAWPVLPREIGLVTRFALQSGGDRAAAIRTAVELRTLLGLVPGLPVLGPRPGDPLAAAPHHEGLPAKLLDKVGALLRKAETTEYPAEAEALTAKAQQLVGDHVVASVLAEHQKDAPRERPIARRILIDDPYAEARAMLLQEIAHANRCRTLWDQRLAMSTVSGFTADVQFVAVLHASLLIQAMRAMTAHGSVTDASGARRTASFRRSFLLGYATRIGERLTAKTREAEAGADDDRLLPVLRSRAEDVDAFVAETLGETVSAKVSATHWGGRAAGFAAANRAELSLFDELESA